MEQQGLAEHEWWLDDVSLNLEAQDPYPYAPRLAISLTPYGQNPWRGPTPVHYAQPLAPYLVGALNLAQTYLNLHRDAQEEFHRRYGGLKGPIMPVHTRNDVENIALCGEEDFGRFSWWRRYRDFGQVAGFWHFNDGPDRRLRARPHPHLAGRRRPSLCGAASASRGTPPWTWTAATT